MLLNAWRHSRYRRASALTSHARRTKYFNYANVTVFSHVFHFLLCWQPLIPLSCQLKTMWKKYFPPPLPGDKEWMIVIFMDPFILKVRLLLSSISAAHWCLVFAPPRRRVGSERWLIFPNTRWQSSLGFPTKTQNLTGKKFCNWNTTRTLTQILNTRTNYDGK